MNYPHDTDTMWQTGQIERKDIKNPGWASPAVQEELPRSCEAQCPHCQEKQFEGWNCHTLRYDPTCWSCKKEFTYNQAFN